MSIYPEILAGYGAALKALDGLDVTVKEPGVMSIPTDPIEMIMSSPDAFSILCVPLPDGINVCRHKIYGFLDDCTMVDYPCPTDAPDFDEQLAAVLRPVVEQQLAIAADKRGEALADAGPSGIEARNQVRRIS